MKYSHIALAGLLSVALLPALTLAATLPRVSLPTPSTTCVSGAPEISLKWSAPIGATSYSIFRNMYGSALWINQSSKQLSTSFIDKNVISGGSYEYQVKTYFANGVAYSNIVTAVAPKCPTLTTNFSVALTPKTSEITFTGYITGYGYPDNTPPSANISNPVIHQSAGGTGTYTDPITIAVGHSIINGKDILDYPAGTKFYIPALRRYFIVEDTCGDGNTPQNGPCHTGYQGHVWLDAWVGGTIANASNVYNCEDKITDLHTVIENPASGYAVSSGPIFNSSCTSLFGETAVAA